ncbi:MAG: transporter substrate-binding protein, partial [Microbacterium sp.]|nr:transporter substrate-binding protein [Microbacterium sp.]
MRRTRTLAGIGIAAVALLALTACNSGTPSSSGAPEDGGEEETSSTPWTVLEDVSIDGSPTFDRISSSGTIKVGVKEDQPGLG